MYACKLRLPAADAVPRLECQGLFEHLSGLLTKPKLINTFHGHLGFSQNHIPIGARRWLRFTAVYRLLSVFLRAILAIGLVKPSLSR